MRPLHHLIQQHAASAAESTSGATRYLQLAVIVECLHTILQVGRSHVDGIKASNLKEATSLLEWLLPLRVLRTRVLERKVKVDHYQRTNEYYRTVP